MYRIPEVSTPNVDLPRKESLLMRYKSSHNEFRNVSWHVSYDARGGKGTLQWIPSRKDLLENLKAGKAVKILTKRPKAGQQDNQANGSRESSRAGSNGL
jgi:hypothetical protein